MVFLAVNVYVGKHNAAQTVQCNLVLFLQFQNMTLLLENNVPYDALSKSTKSTALHFASYSNIETVRALLDYVERQVTKDKLKEFIDMEDSRMYTSLHIAASLGKWQTVMLLLEKGAAIKWYEPLRFEYDFIA